MGTGANATITKLLLQPDGKIIVVGNFTSYNGTSINRIVRLNTDGSIDATFNVGAGANSQIYSAALQSDGKVLIGGTFGSYKGTARAKLARINTNGTIDAGFTVGTGPDSWTYAMAVQPDGKIIIVGNFSVYNGTTVNRIARLTSTGSLDASFNNQYRNCNVSWQDPLVMLLIFNQTAKLLLVVFLQHLMVLQKTDWFV